MVVRSSRTETRVTLARRGYVLSYAHFVIGPNGVCPVSTGLSAARVVQVKPTHRADCFFADGTFIQIPISAVTTIEDIAEEAWMEGYPDVVEIQTDLGIWTVADGFKTWDEIRDS